MAAGNLYALQKFFSTNWTTKWVAAPTWYAREAERKHYTGDSIVYEVVESPEPPVSYNQQWVDRKEVFKFELRSTTQGNLELMREELKYMAHNLFYPTPFDPSGYSSAQSEVLAHYKCNEGAATSVLDSTANNYDFAFDATPPAWGTNGGYNEKNYLNFAPVSETEMIENDAGASDTLLDTFPSALTIEVLAWLDINMYDGNVSTEHLFQKVNVNNEDYLYFQIALAEQQIQLSIEVANGGLVQIRGGKPSAGAWNHFMCTLGPRGREVYLNGTLVATSTLTTLPGPGTAENAKVYVTSGGSHNQDIHYQRLRLSSVQRLPWGTLTVSTLKRKEHGPGYYLGEVEVVGELHNIYVGGNL